MSALTAPNVTVDKTLIHRFTEAVAGHAEVITDGAVLDARGHDFWGVGGTAELLLHPTTVTRSPRSCGSRLSTRFRSCPVVARRTAPAA